MRIVVDVGDDHDPPSFVAAGGGVPVDDGQLFSAGRLVDRGS